MDVIGINIEGEPSFDVMMDDAASGGESSSGLKREELDKFSFDADILDCYTNIETAAAATSLDGERRARARSKSSMVDELEGGSGGRSSTSDANVTVTSATDSSNPGSVSPVTSQQGGGSGGSSGGGGGGGGGASSSSVAHVPTFTNNKRKFVAPMRSLSSQSSIGSNASANSFTECFDDDVEEHRMKDVEDITSSFDEENVYISPSRDESESFMTFEKVDEERLQSGSACGSELGTPKGSPRANPIRKFGDTSGDAGGNVSPAGLLSSIGSSSKSSTGAPVTGSQYHDAAAVVDEQEATAVGRHLSRAESDEIESFGSWVTNNWRTPRFMCFVFGLVLSITFIVICFVLLVDSEGGSKVVNGGVSGGGGGEGGASTRRLRMKSR